MLKKARVFFFSVVFFLRPSFFAFFRSVSRTSCESRVIEASRDPRVGSGGLAFFAARGEPTKSLALTERHEEFLYS